METITTTVTVAKVQTMADGGLRFIFDAPETETLQAAQLMECKRFGVVGRLTFEQIEDTNQVEKSDSEPNRDKSKIRPR